MAFVVASDYDRFMGRWSRRLAPLFAGFAGVAPGQRVLDVGCGTGVLSRHLASVVGEESVAAIDPSPGFVRAAGASLPGADVREGTAEELPWAESTFDTVLAQLVLMFVRDPVTAAGEMVRVARPGASVAAASWDYPRMGMLAAFWGAVREVVPGSDGGETAGLRFGTTDELAQLWRGAGLQDVRTEVLGVREQYADAEDCWGPLTLGVGPAGDYARSLDAPTLQRVHDAFVARLGNPTAGFALDADALCVVGTRP
ncbi:MAG: class I SAM-dependent methyltransferase [Nocardioides sp.]|nr:class I SAM-dependent methyltransferase [Nocardioides sp.]